MQEVAPAGAEGDEYSHFSMAPSVTVPETLEVQKERQ